MPTFTTSDKRRLDYTDEGSGPPVVVTKRRTTGCVLLVLALALSSACNSTNRIGNETATDLGTLATDDTTPDGSGGSGKSGGTSASAPGAAGGGTDGTGDGPRSSPTGDGGTSDGTSASRPGVGDTTPLKLGFIVIKGGDALVTNGLGTPVSFGDGKKQVAALVKDLNARGGILGRPVTPVYYEWNVANANDSPAKGCIKLTEDDHVFAILTVVNVNQEMTACAAKHRTLLINASFGAGDRYLYDHFGDWFFSPSLLVLNEQKALLLQTLRSAGRLKTGVKVGIAILGEEEQYQRVADASIIPTLKAWKVPYFTYVMESDADVSGAVLRFRSEGVNLVIFSSASAIPPLLFMRHANSQGWSPSYALTDADDSNTLGQFVPRNQRERISGVGTQPISNVAVNQHPHSAAEKRCLAIMRAGGENDTNRRSNLTAEPYCEALWDFEAAAKRVSGPLTSAAFRSAFPTVGTSYAPVMTFKVDFANGRHDNAATYRDFAWKKDCDCIGYTGPLRAIPRS
jgi:hypothetical protein